MFSGVSAQGTIFTSLIVDVATVQCIEKVTLNENW